MVLRYHLHQIKIGVGVATCLSEFWSNLFKQTINAQRYQRLFLEPLINQLDDVNLTNGYFQQDLATAHTASS
jgi:hypothetical protein